MVKIYKEMDKNERPNFNGKICNDTKVFKVELRKLSNVSLLMKRLKKRLEIISNNSTNNNNSSNNKPTANENEEDRKSEDGKQAQLQMADTNNDKADGNDYDDDATMLKEWIDHLFYNSTGNKKTEIFHKLLQCYGTRERIYDRVTDKHLQETAKILHCKDRQVLICGVYDHYCRDNYSNCNQDQMVVHNVLTDVFGTNTLELKKYFVAFMNVYDKCDLEIIQQVTPDIIKQDLAMDESIIKRKHLIEKILANRGGFFTSFRLFVLCGFFVIMCTLYYMCT